MKPSDCSLPRIFKNNSLEKTLWCHSTDVAQSSLYSQVIGRSLASYRPGNSVIMNNFLKLLPVFKAVRSSLPSGESFTFAIEGFCPLKNFSVYLDIVKIEVDNDEWDANISPSSIEYTEKGFNLHIDKFKNLKPGRYLIKAGIVPPGKPVPCMSLSKLPTDFGVSIFEIRNSNEPEISHDDLLKDYEKLIKARTKNFLKGFGEASTHETQNYLALVFVKNCLLTKRMRLGQYELIPFEGLACIDITNLGSTEKRQKHPLTS